MPELPEVEMVCRGLRSLFKGSPRIDRFEFLREDLRFPIPISKIKRLEGEKILGVHRRSKYLLWETKKGFLLSHLGMTGSWRVAPPGEERTHDHLYVYLKKGTSSTMRLAYKDPRRFGILDYVEPIVPGGIPSHVLLDHLGPEPFQEGFHPAYLREKIKSRTSPIKNILMDASVVVGVGNIYASEILFRSGVHPRRKGIKITQKDSEELVRRTREVLQEAIDSGGSSIRDYVNANGAEGSYQMKFLVYGKEKKPCPVCGNLIQKIVQSGRSTFFCSHCQT